MVTRIIEIMDKMNIMITILNRLILLVFMLVVTSTFSHAKLAWIWHQDSDVDHVNVDFTKRFILNNNVKRAKLFVTADDEWQVYINQKKVTEGVLWRKPSKVDITKYLVLGSNEIFVKAKNNGSAAGLLFRLEIELKNKTKRIVVSDTSWQATVPGSNIMTDAVRMFNYGKGPWGKVFDKASLPDKNFIAATHTNILPGFSMEKIHTIDKKEYGSWVGLTADNKGRLITCDQYGDIYRVNIKGDVSVERLNIALESTDADGKPTKVAFTGAHGLLYAFDSLYVVVNETDTPHGVYRLQDTTGDDQYDRVKLLRRIKARGEHGIHSLVLSPDGQSMYLVGGNHSTLPEGLLTRDANARGEDHTATRLWNSRGHAKGRLSPGGFILQFKPDGSQMTLIAHGFRNEFDAAFNEYGDLFAFDADMEWDFGSPWYRPTRVNHVVSGADFGWRSGTGKWPAYYPDSLPAVLDIGPGSPTGVVGGLGAKFPAKYQRAIFINDWTFGTMYAVHLEPDGASYKATSEEFLSGRAFPLTDVIIHPVDGNMYFLIGGRRTQSALYRVTYVGNESTEPIVPTRPSKAVNKRRALEKLHLEGVGVKAVKMAWQSLNSSDRHIRYAARVAIEKQPVSAWRAKALGETKTTASIEALIALSRLGDKTLQSKIIKSLNRLPMNKMATEQFLAAVRAYQLCVSRMGIPSVSDRIEISAKLSPFYPNNDHFVDRELSQLLLKIGDEKATSTTVHLLLNAQNETIDFASPQLLKRNERYANSINKTQKSRPNAQQIALAYSLYDIKTGWSPELRKAFFSWFSVASQWSAGNTVSKDIENMRDIALQHVEDGKEREMLRGLATATSKVMADVIPASGPPVIWTVDSAMAAIKSKMTNRNFARGKNLYRAQACFSCHQFNGDGGGIGPNLTQAGNRYTLKDLLENIIEPSKSISDQYGSIVVTKNDGTQIIGREAGEESGQLLVMNNPALPERTIGIDRDEIQSIKPYAISVMPPGLIYALNVDELADLVAYLLSGGNEDDIYYQGGKSLFDGHTLTGWRGDPDLWSVKDGMIYGSTHHKKLKNNTFLIWEGHAGDFHLSYEAKVEGNNSGMQYRSEVFNEKAWRLKGYQADIHPTHEYIAMLYGEGLGRGIVAKRGEKVVVDQKSGKPKVVGKTDPVIPLDISKWHKYEIVCKENHIIHKIDGTIAIDLVDNHTEKRLDGTFGIQLHKGVKMKAWFKNIVLTKD